MEAGGLLASWLGDRVPHVCHGVVDLANGVVSEADCCRIDFFASDVGVRAVQRFQRAV